MLFLFCFYDALKPRVIPEKGLNTRSKQSSLCEALKQPQHFTFQELDCIESDSYGLLKLSSYPIHNSGHFWLRGLNKVILGEM